MNTTTPTERRCEFSPCRKYRYTLWREWGHTDTVRDLFCSSQRARDGEQHLGNRDQYLMVIGLNPSTADETQDDPTIRRCIDFAKRWGFGALCMTNIFAWRDTLPENMKKAADPVGPDNNAWLYRIAYDAGMILAAWGKHGSYLNRAKFVSGELLLSADIHCLKKNADGSPQHPLYVPAATVPIPLQ